MILRYCGDNDVLRLLYLFVVCVCVCVFEVRFVIECSFSFCFKLRKNDQRWQIVCMILYNIIIICVRVCIFTFLDTRETQNRMRLTDVAQPLYHGQPPRNMHPQDPIQLPNPEMPLTRHKLDKRGRRR
jgi:hypothetical protein